MSLVGRRRNVVCVLGRLGNQLFQYSFARWLEAQTGLPSYFDLSMTRRYGIGGSERFRSAVSGRAVRGSAWFPAPGGRLGPVSTGIRQLLGPPATYADITSAGPDDLPSLGPAWWVGYWQRERYARVAKAELRDLLGVSAERDERAIPIVAVHVRRGDYVRLGRALPSDWYRSALQAALERTGDAEIRIVSDDPQWCRENLDLGFPATTVHGSSDLEDFRALADADTLVASPSTFAWWAGYLGGVQVIYPGGEFQCGVPKCWQAIPTEA